MTAERASAVATWGLVGLVIAAAILFGAVGELPLPGNGPRLDIRHLFVGLCLLVAPFAWLLAPRERRPSGAWVALLLAFPAWTALQAIPLPVSLVASIAPERARLAEISWPGPLEGCAGEILPAEPPASVTLTTDPLATRETLLYFFAAALVFLAARSYAAGRAQARVAILAALAALAGAEAVYGLVQWVATTPMVLWREKTAYLDSATGTLINRNHYAQLLYLGLGAVLALMLRIRGGWRREHAERAVALRIGALALAALMLFGVLASRSRAGFGGAALVAFVAALAFLARRGRPRALEVGVTLALLAPILLATGPAVLERMGEVPQEWSGAASRGEVFRTSMRILTEHPVFGTGAGSFGIIWGLYRPPTIEGDYNFAHNDYLQVAIESGAIGLVLVLLPVLWFCIELIRARRRRASEDDHDEDHDDPAHDVPPRLADAPAYAALAAVALHAIVDFGLQIPSNLMLTALLAGSLAAAPRVVRPGALGRAFAIAPALLGFALAPAAVAHSLARWPALEGALPWPQIPSVEHRRASALFDEWNAKRQREDADACAAIEAQVKAQRLQPLSATYAVGYATRALTALTVGGVPGADDERVREAVSRTASIARVLDPWHSRNRNRLVTVSIALGEIDRAMEDARAVARVDTVSRRLIRSLIDIGMPPVAIVTIAEQEPVAYRELLRTLNEEGEMEMLGLLVPPDVAADETRCGAGANVADVLRRVHRVSPLPFLEACLAIADEDTKFGREDSIRAWLAVEYLLQRDYARVRELVAAMNEGPTKDSISMRFAQTERRWDDVATFAQRLIEAHRGSQDRAYLGNLHVSLAEAHAQRGRLGDALAAVERAQAYNPALPAAERWLRELRRGVNPWKKPTVP